MQNMQILLRPIEKRDLLKLNEWKNNMDVYMYLGGGFMPTSIDVQEKWLDILMDTTGNNKRFIIELKEYGAIGMIGLYNINWINKSCELGLFIGELSMRKKGYAKEAFKILEKFALNFVNLRKIKVSVVENNKAAVNMYLNFGFKEIGQWFKERWINGDYCTVILMEKFLV